MSDRNVGTIAASSHSAKRPVICVETGQRFESLSAATTWVGLKGSSSISSAIKRGGTAGGYHWWWADEPLPPDNFFKKECKGRPVICVETGQQFERIKEAAAWAGMVGTNISSAIKRGGTAGGYHWWYADEPLPSDSFFEKKSDRRKNGKAVICVETGQRFESITAATTWAGTKCLSGISSAIKTGGTAGGYHWWWEDEPLPPEEFFTERQYQKVMCVETGQVFGTEKEAGIWAGVSGASNISLAIKTGGTAGGYHWWWADEPMPPKEYFVNRKKRPVVCVETGQRFESVAAAAKWAGVCNSNISYALKKGYKAVGYHWAYADEPMPPDSFFEKKSDRRKNGKAVICVETGQQFERIKDAAAYVGVVPSCIQRAVKTGGSCAGYHWRDTNKTSLTIKAVICVETGQRFESVTTAAKWAGMKYVSNMSNAIKTGGTAGGYHWWWADEPMPPKEYFVNKRNRPIVCVETERQFASIKEAATWAGVVGKNIAGAIKRGGTAGGYHWWWADEPLPPKGFFKKDRKRRPVICVETGQRYDSIKEAAAWAGVAPSSIRCAITSGSVCVDCHWYYADEPMPSKGFFKKRHIGRRGCPVVCVETGQRFENMTEAAGWCGLKTISSIRRALKYGNVGGGYHWKQG